MLSEKPWRLDAILRLLVGMCLSILLGGFLIRWLTPNPGWLFGGNGRFLEFVVGTVSLHGVAFCLIALFIREHGLGWRAAFGFSPHGIGKVVVLAVMVTAIVLPITWILNRWSAEFLIHFQLKPTEQQAVQSFRATTSPAQELFFGIVTVLVAPVVEELLFRGILYPFVRRHSRRVFALWITALIFGFIHWSEVTLIPLTFLALMLTLLYEETGNLTAPIVTHCLFNVTNYYWLLNQRQTGAM